MEEIEINGEKYLKKSDVEEEYKIKPAVERGKAPFALVPGAVMDPTNVCAFGTCIIGESYVYTKVSLEYLKRCVESISKIYDLTNSEGVCIAWSQDMPAVLGFMDETKKNVTGFAIAPRVEKDDTE